MEKGNIRKCGGEERRPTPKSDPMEEP